MGCLWWLDLAYAKMVGSAPWQTSVDGLTNYRIKVATTSAYVCEEDICVTVNAHENLMNLIKTVYEEWFVLAASPMAS